ncbi:tetratricopeptide repeat protein [Actinomadura soli]|uniref:Tetratricopeptide repeat protein n=1 Tax=Actinomadura soli TaxID=2508997 RepID=A0A5C4J8N7_9ACTN|nr:tetratricopeptide repeat protein [Actinomadura soli]TMQ96222.1 tetratricopeptide repeat protein [Actinomadura soli]
MAHRLREGWYDLVPALIELDVLSPSAARELIARIVADGRPAGDLDGAAELCAELGHLPLAVKQAGAYMRQTHPSPAAYLELLRTDPAALYGQTARGADPQRTIAQIWRLTLDHLAATEPLTGDLLHVLAWWAPEDIPRGLPGPLGDPPCIAWCKPSPERTPDPRPVEYDGDPHRRPDDIDHARTQAATLLNHARPAGTSDPAQWPAWENLLPHITALADRTTTDTDTIDTALLLHGAAFFLDGQGAANRALTYFRRALLATERAMGDDHPETLTCRNNLAYAYQGVGDLGRAIPLYEEALADCERVLGGDHPITELVRGHLEAARDS